MQTAKHCWDKVLKLGKSQDDNFKKVLELLEKHDVMNEKFRVKAIARGKNFFEFVHEVLIEGQKVKAIFIRDSLSGELFLNDAWVVTR